LKAKGPLLRTVARTGVRKGLFGAGGRGWLTVGILTALIQFARRKRDEPKVSITEKLEPGQSLVITHLAKDEGRR
jgi:hypothetical protein